MQGVRVGEPPIEDYAEIVGAPRAEPALTAIAG